MRSAAPSNPGGQPPALSATARAAGAPCPLRSPTHRSLRRGRRAPLRTSTRAARRRRPDARCCASRCIVGRASGTVGKLHREQEADADLDFADAEGDESRDYAPSARDRATRARLRAGTPPAEAAPEEREDPCPCVPAHRASTGRSPPPHVRWSQPRPSAGHSRRPTSGERTLARSGLVNWRSGVIPEHWPRLGAATVVA